MITTVQCVFCIHYFMREGRCKAYPDGIPKEILNGGVDHRLPYTGDHGIQLELKPGLPDNILGPLQIGRASCRERVSSPV